MKKITMILAVAGMFIVSTRGQSFVNLNFESAYNLPGNSGETVLTTNALPGWTAYDGSFPLVRIYYVSNTISGGSSSVELEGGSLALSGNFSVELSDVSTISQTGMVPANAESLEFETGSPVDPSSFYVVLGDQGLSYSAISEGPDYTMYSADIPTDLDGQVETLTFTVQSGQALLDNIEFNIPEPGEFALVGLGLVLFGVFNAKARRR